MAIIKGVAKGLLRPGLPHLGVLFDHGHPLLWVGALQGVGTFDGTTSGRPASFELISACATDILAAADGQHKICTTLKGQDADRTRHWVVVAVDDALERVGLCHSHLLLPLPLRHFFGTEERIPATRL